MKLIKEQVVTFRLPVPVARDLDQAAALAGLSRSQLLRQMVEKAIEDLGIKQRYNVMPGFTEPREPREIEPFPGKSQRETLETIYAVMLAQAELTRKQLESLGDPSEAGEPERGQGAD